MRWGTVTQAVRSIAMFACYVLALYVCTCFPILLYVLSVWLWNVDCCGYITSTPLVDLPTVLGPVDVVAKRLLRGVKLYLTTIVYALVVMKPHWCRTNSIASGSVHLLVAVLIGRGLILQQLRSC